MVPFQLQIMLCLCCIICVLICCCVSYFWISDLYDKLMSPFKTLFGGFGGIGSGAVDKVSGAGGSAVDKVGGIF